MPQVNYVKEARALLQFAAKNGLSAKEFVLWHAIFERMNQHAVGSMWPEGYVPISNASLLALTPFGVGKSGEQVLSRTRKRLVDRGLIAYQPGRRQVMVPRYRMMYFDAQAENREAMTWQNRPRLVAGSRESLAMQQHDIDADKEEGTRQVFPKALTHTGVGRAAAPGQACLSPGEGRGEGKKSLVAQEKFCPQGSVGEGRLEGWDEGVYVNLNPNNTKVPGTATTADGAGAEGVDCAGGRTGDKNPRACGQSSFPNADAGGAAGEELPWTFNEQRAGISPASPPAETFDEAWRTSKKVRGAVAQRLLDRYPGPRDREDAWEQFCELLQTGVSPGQILAMYPKRDSLHRVICALKAQRDSKLREELRSVRCR